MLKKSASLLACLTLLTLLAGCRVVLVDETLAEEEKAPPVVSGEEIITLDSSVQFDKKMVVRGQTNLPEGSVLQAGLKEYPDDAAMEQIMNAEVQPLEDFILTGTGEVSEDGTFLIVLKRGEREKRYQLTVEFLSDLQPPHIKEKYGELGEKIGDSEGAYQYEKDGKTYTGIIRFAPIPKPSDHGFYSGKMKLNSDPANADPFW
ncbi:hypothetical protein FZC84_13380 [Rossellomorea vietnamensis]|uniref:Uncharacterized protein n=1 Tax=Rossellomorea vietnamensis TaxID=218284 RepID=A0A5D4MCI2_9BACI|nr:hypothetical protein [Rossellomorea vietnamensis]TYR98705.1 hypothetical protein FZC84_13380 [Rossellomorea vietnamensis]